MSYYHYHRSGTGGFRVVTVYPELYVHVQLARIPKGEARDTAREALRALAKRALLEFYPEVAVEVHIDFEEASLKAWITFGKRTAIGILAVYVGIGGVIQTTEYAFKYIPDVLASIRQHMPAALSPYGLRDTIRTERRKGAIARLDQIINAYQNHEMSYERYMAEATVVLARIAESEDRDDLIPALREYIDTRYGRDFAWRDLERIVSASPAAGPGRSPSPKPPRSHPRPDAALPDDGRRRKRRD